MAIPLTGFVGYIRTRTRLDRGAPKDGRPTEEVELYLDPAIQFKQTAAGPTVTKPADCAGLLYATADGRLSVQYPEE